MEVTNGGIVGKLVSAIMGLPVAMPAGSRIVAEIEVDRSTAGDHKEVWTRYFTSADSGKRQMFRTTQYCRGEELVETHRGLAASFRLVPTSSGGVVDGYNHELTGIGLCVPFTSLVVPLPDALSVEVAGKTVARQVDGADGWYFDVTVKPPPLFAWAFAGGVLTRYQGCIRVVASS